MPHHTKFFLKLFSLVDLCTCFELYHVENRPCPVRFDRCIWFSSFFKFLYSLFFVNGRQSLYVNPGCHRCIAGMNLSCLLMLCRNFLSPVLSSIVRLLSMLLPVDSFKNVKHYMMEE